MNELINNVEILCKTHNELYPLGELTYKVNKKYIKLIRKVGSAKSAFGFIDLENGYLWKANSWSSPAKNKPRGSIFDLKVEKIKDWEFSIS